MTLSNMLLCFACALGIACGQVLMKGTGTAWLKAGTLLDGSVAVWVSAAVCVYGIASIGWVYLLKEVPLSAAYPFLAISFLLVPVAGHVFFNEHLGWQNIAAALLIISGICLVSLGSSGPS